jgi:carbamate kinase
MNDTIIVLVSGEVLADGQGSAIPQQRINAQILSEGLAPILSSDFKIVVMHGNKPQVGFVLYRGELASHAIHTVPLDVCGADTQGATGYMLAQAFINTLNQRQSRRNVLAVITQTVVDNSADKSAQNLKAVGPYFDREKADHYRQTRGWKIVEERGYGYRRGVPSLPPIEIIGIENIQQLIDTGTIVIAAGGGGIPAFWNAQGNLEGIEAVIETERVATMLGEALKAKVLLMIIDRDNKFLLERINMQSLNRLSLAQLDQLLEHEGIQSDSVLRKLKAASDFLHGGGKQVVITTLRGLSNTLQQSSGLWIGEPQDAPTFELDKVHQPSFGSKP